MEKRQWIIVGSISAILLVSCLCMIFLIQLKPELAKTPPRIAERWVKAESVVYRDILSPVIAKGRVTSSAQVELVAEASGRIESGEAPLKKGETFGKGDLLLTIYRDEAELNLKASKSRFLNSVASLLPDIQIDFPDNSNAFRLFFNAIDLTKPLPELPEINGEQLRIFLASRNFLSEYYAVIQEELKLSRHSIYAPFNGVLSDVYFEVGAYINTGGRIGKMLTTDDLEVEVPVDNMSVQWIHEGDQAKLLHPDNDREWEGTVRRISQFVDENTQSRSVFVKVNLNGKYSLVPGEYLNISFLPAPVPDVMEIPRQAVFNFDQVFIVNDGLLKIKTISVVKVTETMVLINGLETDDYIVTQAMINVAENTPVKILGVDEKGID